jgi:hypothetical protein
VPAGRFGRDESAAESPEEGPTGKANRDSDREGWATGRAAAALATLHGRRAVTGDAA